MNLDRRGALELVAGLREHVGTRTDVDVAVVPPFVYVEAVATALAGSPIRVGGQNLHEQASGAFTGEVSAAMLRDVGATLVLVGHSERRHLFGETDDAVNAKVLAALEAGLEVVLCVGETIQERNAGQTEEVVRRHLTIGLRDVAPERLERVTVAYEPVWAIGTGLTPTLDDIAEAHEFLRERLVERHGPAGGTLRILYGGSVKPSNAAEILAIANVDGALVGGASLKAGDFLAICSAVPAA
jgi:triosephosphate isomerase